MSFCKFSSQSIINANTTIDNLFLNEYLPYAPSDCVKVYFYGLYKANNEGSPDNCLESFSKVLGLNEQDIESAFLYWQEQGLVQILNTTPFEVRFLPVKESLNKVTKFNKTKYASFNLQVQEIITGRMLTPTEFNEYYTVIEAFHIKPEALLMIIKYATDLKGKNVGHKYITTVAKNWAYQGIKTAEQVEDRLLEHEKNSGNIIEVLKTLGLKRNANFDERQMYIKWTKELGYLHNDILLIAKNLKKRGGMLKLDTKINHYFNNKLLSIKEIENYEKEKDLMFETARIVTKGIGVYYQDLTSVIETYITDWLQKGYESNTLGTIANYCFKNNIRTLDGMNNVILKFYKLGLVSIESINQYIGKIIATDKQIKILLEIAGLIRNITSWDRDYYRTWTYSWNFSEELLAYAAKLSHAKTNPIKYMNTILANWHENNITTLEKAKQQNMPNNKITKTATNFTTHSYSDNEINALFDNLDEVDI